MSVQAVLEDRLTKKGQVEYLIQWKAKGSQDSWELEEDVESARGFSTALRKFERSKEHEDEDAERTPRKGRKRSKDTPVSTKKRKVAQSPTVQPSPKTQGTPSFVSRIRKKAASASMTASQFIHSTSPFRMSPFSRSNTIDPKFTPDDSALKEAQRFQDEELFKKNVRSREMVDSITTEEFEMNAHKMRKMFAYTVAFSSILLIVLFRLSLDSQGFV